MAAPFTTSTCPAGALQLRGRARTALGVAAGGLFIALLTGGLVNNSRNPTSKCLISVGYLLHFLEYTCFSEIQLKIQVCKIEYRKTRNLSD